MTRRADAIIIGAGVIGAATAYELCKRGYKTLNIDKLPTAGYGPTSNSCAIVRAHYSSRDGVAMAYEGFSYWQDWERYLGVVDDMGMARYMNCGTVLLKSATGHHEKVLTHYRDLGVEYEEWDNATLVEKVPVYSTRTRSGRPSAPTTRTSGTSRGRARRRDLHPRLGLRQRPAARHPQPPARRRGARAASSSSAPRSPRSAAPTAASPASR